LADTVNGEIDKVNTPAPTPATATSPATQRSPYLSGTVVMAGELGIGALLLLSKKKSGTMGMVKTVAGGVLAGAGLKRALKSFNIISGYQSVPVVGRRMGGYQGVPVIGAVRPSQLAGGPGQLQGGNGFRVNGMNNNGYVPTGSGSRVMGAVDPGNACAAGCM